MSECKFRDKDGECLREIKFPYKEYCVDGPCPYYTPQTNYDRVISKTPEELAEIFYTGCENRAYNDNCLVTQKLIERGDLAMSDEEQDEICLKCWLSWLKSPVEEVDDA